MMKMKRRQIRYAEYLDRIYAGWVGKSLGGIIGAPFECHKQFTEIAQKNLWPKILYPNDDLDIQVVWLEALQEYGIAPTSEQLARFWQKHCFYVCCEYGVFIDNLENGIYPPLSGTWNNAFFCASEGCPIRSEIWGFIAPGNPGLAMEYAAKDGCLDHASLSVELEMFLSAAASLSFFETDPDILLEKTCKAVPENNTGRKLFLGVRELCSGIESTYEIWRRLVRTYGSGDGTKALINNAFAFLALFRGGNDFKEVMRLCVQFGWDVDCTCATAGALWGALHGSKAFPEDWLEKMGKTLICACDIPHKTAKLTDFAKETAEIGLEVAALRNPTIQIEGAPSIKVRPLPEPSVRIDAVYSGAPVLFTDRPTCFQLKITNPTTTEFIGKLQISKPEDVLLNQTEAEIRIPAKDIVILDLCASLSKQADAIRSRNLFEAVLISEDGQKICRHIFGLQGSELWQYYGPYWDMWDKDLTDICPYQNDQLTCNPGNVPGFSCDAINCHVRFHHAYLDEETLKKHDLPEEFPFFVEKGGRLFQRKDLTEFDGAACCYLVREFKADHPVKKAQVRFEADCPFECFIDGKSVAKVDQHTKMESTYGEVPCCKLTGDWQRIVVKLTSKLDHFSFQFALYDQVNTFKCAISPYVPLTIRIKR